MRYVVISLDYEIFGNGTGDVRQHMIDPTDRMARIADRYEIPLTVFVDMEEVMAFERHASKLESSCGYNPYTLVRRQVEDLTGRGHDTQLHLHPQWYQANFASGQWQLDETKATVDSLFESHGETSEYIGSRKAALEELAGSSAKPVSVYRAGAFSAQPGTKLIPALVDNEFKIDSSVVHGLQYRDEHVHLDYRPAPAGKTVWRVQDDVAVEDARGSLWEVPITSKPGRRLNQLTFGRLKAKFSPNVPKAQQSRLVRQLGVKKQPVQMVKFLWQPVPLKFDFHNVSSRRLLSWMANVPKPPPGNLDVVVLIGHSKEHLDDAMFDRLLAGLKNEPDTRVASFGEIARMLPALQPQKAPAMC